MKLSVNSQTMYRDKVARLQNHEWGRFWKKTRRTTQAFIWRDPDWGLKWVPFEYQGLEAKLFSLSPFQKDKILSAKTEISSLNEFEYFLPYAE
jgi:hypothetical protein